MNTLLLEKCGGVAVVTLNRPEVLNAVSQELIREMRSTLSELSFDGSVRSLLLRAAGRAFCAGADLTDNGRDGSDLSVGERVALNMDIGFNPLIRDLAAFPKPSVAAVNGLAVGGGVGLALSCDIVIAARSAKFVQVFGPKLAIVPDMGCSWFLPHHLGRARARALALTGDTLAAEDAERWGLIWKCVDDASLADASSALAERLAKGPTRAFAWIKRALDAAPHHSLAEQLQYERDCQLVLADQPEFLEGVQAFLEKRDPKFGDD